MNDCGRSHRALSERATRRSLLLCLAASVFVALKLFIVWPHGFANGVRSAYAACQVTDISELERFAHSEIKQAPAISLAVAALARFAPDLGSSGIGPNSAKPHRCKREIWAANILFAAFNALIVLTTVALPLIAAKLAAILTGEWRSGVPAALITAIFERYTSAIGYGEFENVFASSLFVFAILLTATALARHSAAFAIIGGAAFTAAALVQSQVLMVVPVSLALILAVAVSRPGKMKWGYRASAAFLVASLALAAGVISLQVATARQPLLQTEANLRDFAQRIGIAQAQYPVGLTGLFPTAPSPGEEIGNSAGVFAQLLASTDRMGVKRNLGQQELAGRPVVWILQSAALAFQTFWRSGFFFFFVALIYLPVSWRLAKANDLTPVWFLVVFPPVALVMINALLGPGHWVDALAAIIPIAVVPSHVWRGL